MAVTKRSLLLLIMGLVVACAAPAPTPTTPPRGVLNEANAAVLAAERLATVRGPWTVDEVREGTYAQLWRGSTNDLTGQEAADARAKGPRPAWRVSLTGPNGREELILDRETGALLGALGQGQ